MNKSVNPPHEPAPGTIPGNPIGGCSCGCEPCPSCDGAPGLIEVTVGKPPYPCGCKYPPRYREDATFGDWVNGKDVDYRPGFTLIKVLMVIVLTGLLAVGATAAVLSHEVAGPVVMIIVLGAWAFAAEFRVYKWRAKWRLAIDEKAEDLVKLVRRRH